MLFNDKQLTAYREFFQILGNIQRRCLVEGIDIKAEERKAKKREQSRIRALFERTPSLDESSSNP